MRPREVYRANEACSKTPSAYLATPCARDVPRRLRLVTGLLRGLSVGGGDPRTMPGGSKRASRAARRAVVSASG